HGGLVVEDLEGAHDLAAARRGAAGPGDVDGADRADGLFAPGVVLGERAEVDGGLADEVLAGGRVDARRVLAVRVVEVAHVRHLAGREALAGRVGAVDQVVAVVVDAVVADLDAGGDAALVDRALRVLAVDEPIAVVVDQVAAVLELEV